MTTDRQIVWEDFLANYCPTEDHDEDLDDLDDLDDDLDESIENQNPLAKGITSIPIFFSGNNFSDLLQTPWGSFRKDNKLAPFNFYELKLAHFRGFSTITIDNFTKKIESIDGVALCKILDPYCIIVGKAKLYTWPEIVAGFDKVFLQTDSNTYAKSVNDEIAELISSFADHAEYACVRFPNGKVVSVFPDDQDYEAKKAEILAYKNTMPNITIILNGEIQ